MQGVPYGYCHCGCGEQTKVSPYTDRPRGYVRGEPRFFKPGHHRRLAPKPYEPRDCGYETPCWVWQWGKKETGHGQSRINGKHVSAHRMMWEQVHGPVPDGLELDHLCRNPSCVNPEHLEPVTHAVNMQRGSNARLTVYQVREIRVSAESGPALAQRFGVGTSTVYAIRNGKSWRGV
jgi:hypothetical protein